MKKLFITIIIVLIIVLVLPYSIAKSFRDYARLTLSPAFTTASRTGALIRSPYNWLKEIRSLREENTKLKIQLADLSNQVIEIAALKKENKNLRSELELRPKISGFKRIVATVVSRSNPGSLNKFNLNQGSLNGVQEGDAVIASGSLVGKVVEVLPHNSTITLITSSDAYIQARLSQSGEKGIINGSLNGIYLSDLPTNTKLDQGLIVETSGLGGTMPAGILIGQTTGQKSGEADSNSSVRIRTLVDFLNLDVVFILIRES